MPNPAAQATTAREADPSPDLKLVPDEAGDLTRYEDENAWEEQGRQFKRQAEKSLWDIADWIVAAENSFDAGDKEKRPDRYTRAAELTSLGYGRLRNLACTARAFPASRRRYNLSFAH